MIFNLVSLLIFLIFNSAESLDFPEKKNDVSVEIVPKNGIFMVEDNYYFGIKFNLTNGWKTYWKNPGDAGEPISINLINNKKDDELELLFPFPQKFIENEIRTIGYENEVIFPVKVSKNLFEKIDKKIELNYLICKDVCLPIKEIKALRFGSYSIDITVPLISYLFRLKSIKRYRRLCPPPL